MHLQGVKKISKAKKVYKKKLIDKSFIFLMKGIMAYDVAYRKYIDSKTKSYLAEIEDLNIKLSKKLTENPKKSHEQVEEVANLAISLKVQAVKPK